MISTAFFILTYYFLKCKPFWIFLQISSKHLGSGDHAKCVLVDAVSSVGIEKALAIAIGAKIKGKRPRAPEEIHVSVPDASSAEIDIATERPTVKDQIRQAIIAVQ